MNFPNVFLKKTLGKFKNKKGNKKHSKHFQNIQNKLIKKSGTEVAISKKSASHCQHCFGLYPV